MALSEESVFKHDVLLEHSIKFASQVVALANLEADKEVPMWKAKPKLHLFLELCADGSNPSKTWTYRDEDWGGSVARMARRRGQLLTLPSFSSNVLARFKMQQPIVRLV